jgi:hypothetical protein
MSHPDWQPVSTRPQTRTKESGATNAEPTSEPTGRSIYVRAVVDVASVLQDFPDAVKDAETPTAVGFDRGQMIVTTTVGAAAQGTGAIALNASAGDTLRFFAKSGSNNFEHAVLIHDIRRNGDDEPPERAASVNLLRTGITPAAQAHEQPEQGADREFWFWQYAVPREGTQSYSLHLALYDRDEDGQPRFAGLYRWDLQLTIQDGPPPPQASL